MKNFWKKISKNTLDLANGCLMLKINEKLGLVRVLIINWFIDSEKFSIFKRLRRKELKLSPQNYFIKPTLCWNFKCSVKF